MLRPVCFLASSILLVLGQDARAIDFTPKELVVQTTSGAVRGTSIDDHAWAWLGIPYGRPPFGSLRWKAPEEPASWDGIRLCDAPARRSRERGGVEDRLYLNVWRPQTNERLLPVLNTEGPHRKYSGDIGCQRVRLTKFGDQLLD